ncbi:MAG: hypothetical protein ACQESK_00655 [Bacteroidota bacterium]
MKNFLLIFFFLYISATSAQSVFEDYEYVVVPMKFSLTDEEDEYRLNTLVRYLLKEEGFKAYMSEEHKPIDFEGNPCDGLYVDVQKERKILTTEITIEFYDCRRKLVYKTDPGISREKSYKKAYQEGIREAFKEIEFVNFNLNETVHGNKKERKLETKEEKEAMRKKVIRSQSTAYKKAGSTFLLFPVDDNYELYDEQVNNKLAELNKADRGSYIYSSKEINGAAYFTPEGDLVLEYRDEITDEMKEIRYLRE